LVVKSGATVDYESLSNPTVTIRTTDSGGLIFDETFTLSVSDINDKPTNISLDSLSIAENSAGAHVANIGDSDPDGDTLTYNIVGGADAALFEISDSGDKLLLASDVAIDFETKNQLAVELSATDDGDLSFNKSFTVNVLDINDQPIVSTNLPDQRFTLLEPNLAYSYNASNAFLDVDAGDSLNYTGLIKNDDDTLSALPSWLSLDVDSGILTGTPEDGDIGLYNVVMTAIDHDSLFVSDTFNLEVVHHAQDAMVKTADNFTLDGLALNLWENETDLNQSLAINTGEIGVTENITFDAIKLSNANAYRGELDIRDVMGVLKHIVQINSLEGQAFHAGDVNNDEKIDIRDVMAILKDIVEIEKIDTFDLIDSSGNRVDQVEDGNPATLPEWTLIANGDVNQSGSFADDHIVQVGTSEVPTEPPIV